MAKKKLESTVIFFSCFPLNRIICLASEEHWRTADTIPVCAALPYSQRQVDYLSVLYLSQTNGKSRSVFILCFLFIPCDKSKWRLVDKSKIFLISQTQAIQSVSIFHSIRVKALGILKHLRLEETICSKDSALCCKVSSA